MVVHIQGFPGRHYCPRMATMNKPCYAAIKDLSPTKPAMIFVASRRQTRLTALDLISYAAADENPRSFLHCDDDYIEAVAETLNDKVLRHTITFGIGLHHAGLTSRDREKVERLYLEGHIQVLIATATLGTFELSVRIITGCDVKSCLNQEFVLNGYISMGGEFACSSGYSERYRIL